MKEKQNERMRRGIVMMFQITISICNKYHEWKDGVKNNLILLSLKKNFHLVQVFQTAQLHDSGTPAIFRIIQIYLV